MAQTLGGTTGAVLANVMFDRRIIELATKEPLTTGHFVGEVVAMAGLVVVIFALARTERAALSAGAVGAYIGAAYWFTAMLTGWPLHSHCRKHLERDQLGRLNCTHALSVLQTRPTFCGVGGNRCQPLAVTRVSQLMR